MSNILEKFFSIKLTAAAFFVFEKNFVALDFVDIWL